MRSDKSKSSFRVPRRFSIDILSESHESNEEVLQLERVHKLQAMRKLLADAEVTLAQQLLSVAQESLLKTYEQHRALVDRVRENRSAAAAFMLEASSASMISLWRLNEFKGISKIRESEQVVRDSEKEAEQMRDRLDERIQNRRTIHIRKEKYAEIIKEVLGEIAL